MSIESMMWQEGWTPTSDTEVTQMLRYLSEKKKETDRIVKSAHEEIAQIEAIGKDAEDKLSKIESRITYLLERYVMEEVDEEDRRVTETTIKYKLARGEIVIKKASSKLEKPTPEEEVILSAVFPKFVKKETTTVFQWGEFKKELELTEAGKVIHTPTRKEVTVPVVKTAQSASIKLKL